MDSIDKLKNISKMICQQIEKRLEFECFYIALYHRANQIIEFPLVIDKGKEQEWPSRTCQFNGRISPVDFVIKNREILSIDRNFIWTIENQKLIFWSDNDSAVSWLGIPLMSDNQIIGVLAVENRSETKIWGKDDINFLSLVAAQLANKARDIFLHDRKVNTYKSLNNLIQKLTSDIRLTEQEILELIYKQATRLMDTSNMYIAMYEFDPARPDSYDPQSPEKNEIHGTIRFDLMYIDNEKTHLGPRKAKKGEYGRTEVIISTREPIINATKEDATRWYHEHGHKEFIGQTFASWIGVPMSTSGGRVIGVIATYHKDFEYLYDDEDLQVLKMMAVQAATAIDNVRTYKLVEKQNQELAALQDIGLKITSELNLKDVLGAIVEQTNSLMSADFSTLYTFNENNDCFETGIRKGKIEGAIKIPSTKRGSSYQIVKGRELYYPDNAEQDSFTKVNNIKSWAGISLVCQGKTFGILYVNYLELIIFDDYKKSTLRFFASLAAVAIKNAQKLDSTEKQKKALTELLSLNDLAGRFVHKVNNLAGNIPIDTDFIKEAILEKGIHDRNILDDLNGIKKQAQNLVDMARRVQQSTAKLKRTGKILEKADAVFLMNKALVHTTGGKELPRHQIIKDYKISPLMIETFESLFTEALSNIISNALDAMPDGGKLTLSAEIIQTGDTSKARLKIKDTGTGIPKEDVEKIYDIDYSKKSGGLGYGLWSVRRICDAVGADIRIESEVGKGTSFYLEIPLAES